MKILIVSDAWHPQVNGVVRTYECLIPELETMGHTVRVVGPSDFPVTVPLPGYAEIRLPLFPSTRLEKIFDAYRPDLLHIATEGSLGFAARAIAKKRNMRFTTCYHTHFPDYAANRTPDILGLRHIVKKAAVWFVRLFHAPSSCVFVATPTLKEQLTDWSFKAPLKTMTRGIDASKFYPNGFRPNNPRPVALYVGRIAVEKNIRAFLDMNWDGRKILVGGGPDLDGLKKLYAANQDIDFKGPLTGDALREAYQNADIFVFPSKTDTFGMVLVEAMACGLPIAAYPVCGPADIVTEDFLGTLDEDLSVAATAARSAPGTAQMREDHARKHYTWRVAAMQFLEEEQTIPFPLNATEPEKIHVPR